MALAYLLIFNTKVKKFSVIFLKSMMPDTGLMPDTADGNPDISLNHDIPNYPSCMMAPTCFCGDVWLAIFGTGMSLSSFCINCDF